MSSSRLAPSAEPTPSTSLSSIASLKSEKPAFSALLERFNAQKSDYTRSALPADLAQLCKTFLSSHLPAITKIVCLGLGTLTRIPNARWDPECSTYQFLLLEDIANIINTKHTRNQLRPSRPRHNHHHFYFRRKPASTPPVTNLDIYLQDPSFIRLDEELITVRLPRARFLTASAESDSTVLGAEPAAQHVDATTLLYMPFLPADILITCLANRKPAVVICVNVRFLLRHISDNPEALPPGRVGGCDWFAVLAGFLGEYEGFSLPVGRERRWEEPFDQLVVYRRKGDEGKGKGQGKGKEKGKRVEGGRRGCDMM